MKQIAFPWFFHPFMCFLIRKNHVPLASEFGNPKKMKIELFKADYLNFVELNISGNNDIFNKCDQESFYLETEVFNLFSPCFERSNDLYDYFIPTLYNSRRIIPLQNELKKHLALIVGISNPEEFSNFANGVFLGKNFLSELDKMNRNWADDWENLQKELVTVNQALIDLTDLCITEERNLWVLGY
jgi:hypothetical protein